MMKTSIKIPVTSMSLNNSTMNSTMNSNSILNNNNSKIMKRLAMKIKIIKII